MINKTEAISSYLFISMLIDLSTQGLWRQSTKSPLNIFRCSSLLVFIIILLWLWWYFWIVFFTIPIVVVCVWVKVFFYNWCWILLHCLDKNTVSMFLKYKMVWCIMVCSKASQIMQWIRRVACLRLL